MTFYLFCGIMFANLLKKQEYLLVWIYLKLDLWTISGLFNYMLNQLSKKVRKFKEPIQLNLANQEQILSK